MAVIDINSIMIGQTIGFRTINTLDNVKRVGLVTGMCDYEVAKIFLDVDTYHQQVLHTNPGLGSAKDLHYLLISYKEDEESTLVKKIAIAKEWMSASSVELVEDNPYIDFRVYNISALKANDVVNAIKSLGYDVSIRTQLGS